MHALLLQFHRRAMIASAPIFLRALCFSTALVCIAGAQPVTTAGFLNQPRSEAPGTLLSHPLNNDSEAIGRTTSLNYHNGWLIVGGEVPGSRPGSDLLLRVYDIANPSAPVSRLPSDFGLAYTGNRWVQDNYGFNAHGTVKIGDLLAPAVLEVAGFGAPVRLGGQHGLPDLGQIGIGYNRSSQAGPWTATFPWYGSPDQDFAIQRVTNNAGYNQFQTVATFDHVGPYGGGDWHPMFFGDLLIYARSGGSARDGVVVYRLEYNNYDDPVARSITPRFVGSLPGGFQGYWPVLFSDGDGLYVVGSTTDILLAADVTQAAHPSGDGSVRLAASLTIPNFTNASYPVFQDNFAFIHNRKIDMSRFVAGDADPIVLTLNEVAPPVPAGSPAAPAGVNTSQMSLALGNLWITGGYPLNYGTPNYMAQGMAVWVHQQAPDTTRPRVAYHIPQSGRTGYPRHAPLSFLIPEHSRRGGPRVGTDLLVRPVTPGVGGAPDTLGAPVTGMAAFDFSGVLTFTPSPALAADTTYQVDFVADDRGTPADLNDDHGFQDASGNLIEPYSFRFSTGGGINAAPPPVLASVSATLYQPAPGQQTVVTASATGDDLEYRFNFDGVWTDWSDTPSAAHAYADAGRPRVLVQVRDASGQIVNGSLKLLVIPAPAAGPRPTQSSTLAVGQDPAGRRVWVVNPDAHTVAVLDAATGAKLAEHSTGANSNPRSVARDALGRYWVTCHGSDEVRVFNPDGAVAHSLVLPYGSAPFGVAASPDGQSLFVTLHGSGRLLRYSAASPAAVPASVDLFPTARALAVSADGQRVLVTRFISPDLEAEVADVTSGVSLTHVRTIRLAASNVADGGDRASGVPNYLSAVAISPDGARAAVASKQDNVQRGLLYGVGDLTHETAVRAVVSFIDLAVSNSEIPHSRRDFDNSADPSALAYTPLGDTLLVALQGSNTVVGLDALNLAPVTGDNAPGSTATSPAVLAFELSAGLSPQGILLDPVSNRLFTQNFMGRTVTVRDAAPLLLENRTALPALPVSPVSTVATETLAPDVLLGKQIFYNAADFRMSADGYISCATCHADGGADGRAWDFTGRGEGLRRTTDLRGRSGLGHGRVHWSGNFDEIQDFEHDIRGPFGGAGFLPINASQFAALHPTPATGKTGLSPELDALAAYVASLAPASVPRSPHRNADGTLPAAALRGRDVFTAQSCAGCHSGPRLTDSALGPVSTPNLHDTGTLSALSGLRLHDALEGIDTPTLHGLHANRAYLHHGEAPSLSAVFSYAGGALRLASQAELVGLPGSGENSVVAADNPAQGGGGFYRGALGGTSVALSGAADNAVRFTALDGGLSGGAARLAIRYVRQYGGSTASLVVNNGTPQNLALERQYPDNGWQISGWRWLVLDVTLLPGANNVIELRRGSADWHLNAILLANADDLAAAHPHRRVLALPEGDRSDLLAYLRTLDGRDDAGVPLAAPAPPSAVPPAVLVPPASLVVAVGNPVSLHIAISGTGPFSYQWRRGATPVGVNSPLLEIPAAALADAGDYTVQVTNSVGETTSAPATLAVNAALSVVTTELPRATAGRAYEIALSAAGGIDARAWSLASGALPAGLALSADGRIHGTPAAPARAVFTVRVADSSGFATRALALDVRPVGGFSADPDLVLHYTFDEGTGSRVWDSSPAGNDHTTDVPNIPAGFPVNGAASWVADGRFGGAYGSANLSGGLAPFFPANQGDLDFDPRADAFTISIWVRTTTANGYRTILSKNGFADENWRVQYRMWTTNNPVTNVQGVSGDGWSGPLATTLNDGQWHLLTLVNYLDGAVWRTRLYLDGGATFIQWNTGAGGRTPRLLAIGDTSNGYNGWSGQIDDLRIYRRALAPAEITALYSAPAAPAGYDTWIAGLANPPAPEHRDPAATPPGGTMPNLLAYALNLDPLSPAATSPVTHSLTPSFPRSLALTFTRHRADLDYVVEASSDLATWTPIATNPGVLGAETTVQDTVDLSPGSPRRFLRLRVNER